MFEVCCNLGYYHDMDISSYNSGIKYEALQEVITQLIARLSSELHSSKANDPKELSEIITDLVSLKKDLTPDDTIGYRKGLLYVQEVMSRWSLE